MGLSLLRDTSPCRGDSFRRRFIPDLDAFFRNGGLSVERPGVQSPWRDTATTSCVFEPTLSMTREGSVVREDGGPVEF
jgi:hypothetical protein